MNSKTIILRTAIDFYNFKARSKRIGHSQIIMIDADMTLKRTNLDLISR